MVKKTTLSKSDIISILGNTKVKSDNWYEKDMSKLKRLGGFKCPTCGKIFQDRTRFFHHNCKP